MSSISPADVGRRELSPPMRLLGDGRLAGFAARGDAEAFAEIYRRYHQAIYRYCRSIVVDREDAADALQATMASALRALPGESREINLKPWLYRVAHNECVSLLRRRRPSTSLDDALELPAPDGSAAGEARVQVRQLVEDLHVLGERQRSALVLRELSGLSYEEIGEALETSSATAKQTVYEARVALFEIAEGRAVDCESIRHALSDGDGRTRRARKLRAHMRCCEECRAFEAVIVGRQAGLKLLAPPLGAPAAASIFAALFGSGGAGGSGGLTIAVAGAGTTAAAKGIAVVVATLAVSAGGYQALERAPDAPAASSRLAPSTDTASASGDAVQRPGASRIDTQRAQPKQRSREETRQVASGSPSSVSTGETDSAKSPAAPQARTPGDQRPETAPEPVSPATSAPQPTVRSTPAGDGASSPAGDAPATPAQDQTAQTPVTQTPAASYVENVPSPPVSTATPGSPVPTTTPTPPVSGAGKSPPIAPDVSGTRPF